MSESETSRATGYLSQPERTPFAELATEDDKVRRALGNEPENIREDLWDAWVGYKEARMKQVFQGTVTPAHIAFFDYILMPDQLPLRLWADFKEDYEVNNPARTQSTQPISPRNTLAEAPFHMDREPEPSPIIIVPEEK